MSCLRPVLTFWLQGKLFKMYYKVKIVWFGENLTVAVENDSAGLISRNTGHSNYMNDEDLMIRKNDIIEKFSNNLISIIFILLF